MKPRPFSGSFLAFTVPLLLATAAGAGQTYDLPHVDGIESFVGSARAQDLLATNGFVVAAPTFRQIFEPYIESPLPVLVTVDSAWHTYHFLLEHGVKEMESSQAARLASFSGRLLAAASDQVRHGHPEFAELAKYAAVGSAFQEPPPTPLADELGRIVAGLSSGDAPVTARIGFPLSPVNFRPQSFYAESPQLAAYYRARQWYATVDFRVTDDRETRLALCLAWLIHSQPELLNLWRELTAPYDTLVAPPDDATVGDYFNEAARALGTNCSLAALGPRVPDIVARLRAHPKLPRINDQFLDPAAYARFPQVTAGFRLLPSRQLPCAVCLQKCAEPDINGRWLPSGLDFFAASSALRSPAALRAERQQVGQTVLTQILKTDPGPLPDSLYGQSLTLLKTLQEPWPSEVPAPFRTEAWADLKLWTQLGAWAEQRHTWALHDKPAVTFSGLAAPPPGRVEPYPAFFSGLAALCRQTSRALGEGLALPQTLTNFAAVCDRLALLAQKELAGTPPTPEDAAWISGYGVTLGGFHFYWGNSWLVPSDDFSILSRVFHDATDRFLLYAAVARPQALYVILPYKGRMQLYRGAVLNYREFASRQSDSLSDESWQARVREGPVPPALPFTSAFLQEDYPDEAQTNRLIALRFAGQDLAKPAAQPPISLTIKRTLLARLPSVARDPQGRERMMSSDDERHVILVEAIHDKERFVHDGIADKAHDSVQFESLSPDSQHVVYAAADNGDYCAVKDGVAGKTYDKIEALREDAPLVFSPNGLRLAYKATPSPGQRCVVIDEVQDPPYDEIVDNSFSFSANSAHYIYAARREGEGLVVKDGQVVVRSDGIGWSQTRQAPCLNADGQRFGCLIRRGSEWFANVDGKDSHPWAGLVDRWPAAFSPDGRQFRYVAQGADGMYAVAGDQELPTGIFVPPTFSPNGSSLVTVDADDSGTWVTVNGKPGRKYPGTILQLEVSPDGRRVGYFVEAPPRGIPITVIHNEQEFENTTAALPGSIRFSPDSTHFSISGHRGGKAVVIIDGKQYPVADTEEAYAEVSFSPNSQRWAYQAAHGGHWYWVVSGVEYGPYTVVPNGNPEGDPADADRNEETLYFSPDSQHFAFRATRDGRHLLVVDGLERELDDEWFPHSIIIFDSPNTLHLIVRHQSEATLLEASLEPRRR